MEDSRIWRSSSTIRTRLVGCGLISHGSRPTPSAADAVSSKTDTRFLPARLAAYRASSPRRKRSSAAGVTSSGSAAMPKLAVTRPAVREGMLGQHLPDAVGVEPGAGLGGLDQQHGELVAAVAGDHVDAARVLHQDLGHDLAQRVVAATVWPRSSLTALKPSRSRSTTDTGWLNRRIPRHLLLQPHREEAPVVEPGHLVLERELLEPRVGELELLVGGVEARWRTG